MNVWAYIYAKMDTDRIARVSVKDICHRYGYKAYQVSRIISNVCNQQPKIEKMQQECNSNTLRIKFLTIPIATRMQQNVPKVLANLLDSLSKDDIRQILDPALTTVSKSVKNNLSNLRSGKSKMAIKASKVYGHKWEPIHMRCRDAYDGFHLARTGIPAPMDGSQVKALKGMVTYFRRIDKVKTDDDVYDAFEFIYTNWEKLDKKMQGQISLSQIKYNLSNIIAHLRKASKTDSLRTIDDELDSGELDDVINKLGKK